MSILRNDRRKISLRSHQPAQKQVNGGRLPTKNLPRSFKHGETCRVFQVQVTVRRRGS